VLVLGGSRAAAPQRRGAPRQEKRLAAAGSGFYNHYADGCGFWDGDQIGLDGAARADDCERWEGCATAGMGPSLGPQ